MTTIKCPFCNQGEIEYNYKPSKVYERTKGSHRGRSVKGFSKSKEIEEVLTDCPTCHKTKSEIQEKLKHSEEPSKNSVLERLKAAGMPTKI